MIAFMTLDAWTCPNLQSCSLLVDRLEHSLPVNVKQDADAKKIGHQIGTAVADERKGDSLVRQKRHRDAHVNRSLQTNERNNSASKEQAEAILGVERNHHPTDNDDDEEEDDEQTD